MNEELKRKLACELLALSVFRNILNTETMQSFISFLTEKDDIKKINFFGEFVYSLAEFNYSFSNFLSNAVLTDENKYILSVAQKKRSIRNSFGKCNKRIKDIFRPFKNYN